MSKTADDLLTQSRSPHTNQDIEHNRQNLQLVL